VTADTLPFPAATRPTPAHRPPRTSRAHHAPVPEALQRLNLRVMDMRGQTGTVLETLRHARIIEVEFDQPQDNCWGIPGASHGIPAEHLLLWDDEHRTCYGDPWDARLAAAAVTWCPDHHCTQTDCPAQPQESM
jgi:hypothetical protein